MLLIQIALAIAAWRKGWRWRALIPFAFSFGAGVLLGLTVGAAGGSIEQIFPAAIVVELGVTAALIVMAVRKPARAVERAALGTIFAPPIPKA